MVFHQINPHGALHQSSLHNPFLVTGSIRLAAAFYSPHGLHAMGGDTAPTTSFCRRLCQVILILHTVLARGSVFDQHQASSGEV
jgi:hypothetical protein